MYYNLGVIEVDISSKPIKRSKARIFCGQLFYTLKKYIQWWSSGKKYSRRRAAEDYEYCVFQHSTPLYRKLKDVEMYLQCNKVENLKLAIKNIDGIVLKPGEYFSYWRLIGKPSKLKGYKKGMALTPRGGFKEETGGGLCQLSNLIYWNTLHTPLTVTERFRHSHDIFPDANRTQPFGSGATCHYNYLDLEIKNNTSEEYEIKVWLTAEELVGQWRANKKIDLFYEVYEKEHSITPGRFGGYIRNNVIYRRVKNSLEEELYDEYITENHAIMVYEPFLKEGIENK